MSDALYDAQQAAHRDAILQVVDGKKPIDAKLLSLSDWLNPILVKETRQALKSRQFLATFGLTLLAVLIWTIVSISVSIPGIYYLPGGGTLLGGYFTILMVPVCVVVPMSAFRSMAAELEDGTHDILSLSTLSSRQVVLGKLAVAGLQSLIYFSAIVPCIALTYLLRGVGLGSIVLIILGTAGLSILFSSLALLFATLARTRDMQVLMTVSLFLILAPTSWMWMIFIFSGVMGGEIPLEDWRMWFSIAVFMLFGLSYVWLSVLAAAAKIGFASDNHSTRIRWMLLIQHLMYMALAISISAWNPGEGGEIWVAFISMAAFHWAIAGSLMIGEKSVISPRTQRTLPRSSMGRLFKTWLNPGAGAGYVFCVLSFGSTVLVVLAVQSVEWNLSRNMRINVVSYTTAIACYLALYLGIARVLLMSGGKTGRPRMLLSVLTVVVLMFVCGLFPMLISYWSSGYYTVTYEPYMFTHVPWTLYEIVDGKGKADAGLIWLILSSTIVFVYNLLFAFRDVMLVRIETPKNVRDELGIKAPETPEAPVDPLAAEG